MSVTEEYLANNAEYARTFKGPLPMPPSKHVAVVACMDARLDVYRILGLGEGEAHVIRNAGGVVTDDVIRSLAISQRLLGTPEIVLIHHTDCGMLTFTDDDFKRSIQDETGQAAVGRRGVPRCGRGCPAVAAPDREQPVRHQARVAARLRLRCRHRQARGSDALSRRTHLVGGERLGDQPARRVDDSASQLTSDRPRRSTRPTPITSVARAGAMSPAPSTPSPPAVPAAFLRTRRLP